MVASHFRCVCVLISAWLCISPSVMAMSETTEDQDLAERRAWVAEVEAEDYFYWSRFFYRLDNPGEFPLPTDWYRPGEMVLGAPGPLLPERPASERRLSQETRDALDAYLAPRKTGAFYVMHEGQIEHAFFGNGFHEGSLLAIRSITKSINSLLIGIAIEQGYIASADEPIGTYLTEWQDDPRGDITVRQVLHMSTGLETIRLRAEPDNKVMQLAEGSDVYAASFAFEMTGTPDTQWTLNQVDSQLLGMIIERATGKRFADYLSEVMWRPMGLGTATVNLDGKRGMARTFCCMRARAMDVAKIGQMVLDGGRWNGQQIVPEAWIDEIRVPSPANPQFGLHIFLGWNPDDPKPQMIRNQEEPYAVPGVFFFMGGASIVLWMIPSEDLVIFRWGDDPEDWEASYLPNLIIEDLNR